MGKSDAVSLGVQRGVTGELARGGGSPPLLIIINANVHCWKQALVCIHEVWESIDFFFNGDAVAENFREVFMFFINMQAR